MCRPLGPLGPLDYTIRAAVVLVIDGQSRIVLDIKLILSTNTYRTFVCFCQRCFPRCSFSSLCNSIRRVQSRRRMTCNTHTFGQRAKGIQVIAKKSYFVDLPRWPFTAKQHRPLTPPPPQYGENPPRAWRHVKASNVAFHRECKSTVLRLSPSPTHIHLLRARTPRARPCSFANARNVLWAINSVSWFISRASFIK